MVNEKWLYFRTVADEDDDDGDTASAGTAPTSLCVPAANLICIQPVSDTTIQMNFESIRNSWVSAGTYVDTVVLTVNQGKTHEAMNGILQAINSTPHSDGFVVIADDVTTNYANAATVADYIHPDITACGAIFMAGKVNQAMLPSLGVGGAALTAISDTLTLSVNTHYKSIAAIARVVIPAATDGKAGDWITVSYGTVINNGVAHTYTTTTDTAFAPGSIIRVLPGADDNDSTRVGVMDEATTNDNVITITGLTDGDAGPGTYLKFVNVSGGTNGWAVEALITHQGKGNVASAAAFS
tara:strand:+ start:530 stop:1420 length:891 start_codon:yes stop_codon:yes gene_type:complete